MKQAALPFRRPQYDAMTTPRGLLRMLIITVCLSLAQPFAAVAQTSAPTPLPPAAQEALNKGILAAKVPDYLLAIRYFEEARKLAPQAPVVYLNMGLAESRIPGRELRAMAWFGAYLAAYPDAPNAAAVKEQIAMLEVRNQSNASRLLNSLEAAASASQIRGEDYWYVNLRKVAELWAEAGDVAAATKTAGLIPRNYYKDIAWDAIANSQLKMGDIAGAQRAATEIMDVDLKCTVAIGILETKMTAGNIAGTREALASAQKAAGLAKNYGVRIKAQKSIAAIQMKMGDSAGARISFANAKKNADIFSSAYDKANALTGIAEAQMKAGDITGGHNTLEAAQTTADLIQEAWEKGSAYLAIALVHVKNGDIGRAQKAVAHFGIYEQAVVQENIVKLQIKNGDLAGALKTAEPIKADNKSRVQTAIAEAQIQAGDIRGAKDTLTSARKTAELIETPSKSEALTRIAEAQAKTGDMAGAKATLESAQKAADLIPLGDGRGIVSVGARRNGARSDIARAYAKLGVVNPRTIVWLDQLDNDFSGGLNTASFLDLAGHLKSLPTSGDSQKIFDALHKTAEDFVKAQNVITGMLKQQAKQ
jgi:tetratricopeptide (TPR) repeat protein